MDQTERARGRKGKGRKPELGPRVGQGGGAEGGGGIERSAYRMDERMRESGTRNCTALEKIAFPLIISSHG